MKTIQEYNTQSQKGNGLQTGTHILSLRAYPVFLSVPNFSVFYALAAAGLLTIKESSLYIKKYTRDIGLNSIKLYLSPNWSEVGQLTSLFFGMGQQIFAK